MGLIPGVAGETRDAAGAARDIAGEIQRAGLGPALAQLSGLADVGTLALTRLRTLAGVGTPALRNLAPRVSQLLESLDVGPAALAECDRRLRTGAPIRPGQVACVLRLIPNLRAQLRRVRATLDQSLAVQKATEALTATGVTLFRKSLGVQQEALVHVRSLDTQLGGTIPVITATP